MGDFLSFTIVGLALGSIYAIAASGLVVTYTTSGIFNLAHGATAMAASFVYWQLRFDDGWGGQWPAPLALVAVIVVIAPLYGVLVERFIIRWLEDTTEITKLFVTVVILTFMIGLVNWVWGDLEARRNLPFFGTSANISLGDVSVTAHQIIALACAVGMAVGLRLFLYRTVTGISMRAVVDDRPLLQLNGGRPDRASSLSWAIGSALAALAGILISSLPGSGSLSTLALTLLVVNAFAAAIFGRLASLPLTFLGAMILGLSRSYWDWISNSGSKWSWLSGLRPSLPVLLLFVVLLLLPQERLRGAQAVRTRERFRLPSMRQTWLWAGGFVVLMWALTVVAEPAPVNILSTGVALSIVVLSLTLLTGYAGEINLAPLTFAGIGAMVAWQVDVGPGGSPISSELSVWGLLAATVITAVVGALVALPAIRLRGLYLALATFAFAVLVTNLVFLQIRPLSFNIPFVGDGEDIEINLFTNGNLAMPRPNWFGIDFRGAENQSRWFLLLSVVFALLGVGLIALRRSAYGRRLAAMKDSPAACATLGMNIKRTKLSVFALSAGIAGFGGVLYGAQLNAVSAESFDIFVSLPVFMLAVAGGIGYVSGAYLAGFFQAVLFAVFSQMFVKLGADYPSFEGFFEFLDDATAVMPAMLAITVAKRPSGIADQFMEGFEIFRHPKARPYLYAMVVVQAALWGAAAADLIGNWSLALWSIFLWLVGGQFAASRNADLVLPAEELEARAAAVEAMEPMAGIDRPFTDADRIVYDQGVGLDGHAAHNVTTASGGRR